MSRRNVLGLAGAGSLAVLLAEVGSARAAASHPQLRKAIDAMQDAYDYLDGAKRIFGGHRAKAMGYLKDAISECKDAIAFADK
jgi:hypothetical protein